MGSIIEQLVNQAKDGDREALESLVMKIKDRIYGLAIRMLGNPEDAEDNTQEILLKIITHLAQFRGESAFTTWVFKVAANHLLTTRKRRAEHAHASFDDFAAAIDRGMAETWSNAVPVAEIGLLVEEMMISCTQGMLLCMDREYRIAYILGEVFQVNSDQGGFILDIQPAAYRKRLSRARNRLHDFMQRHCSLVNPANPCACTRQVLSDWQEDGPGPKHFVFTKHPCRVRHDPTVVERLQEMGELKRVAAVFRSHPEYAAPDSLEEGVKALLDSGRFSLFNSHVTSRGIQTS